MKRKEARKGSFSLSQRPEKQELIQAVNCTIEAMEQRLMLTATAAVPAWTSQGPTAITQGQNQLPANNLVSGAVQAIGFNPIQPTLAFIGTPNGGIWRTQNFNAAPPTWTPLTDNLISLSMGSLAIAPLDGSGAALTATTPLNKIVVYAGIADSSSHVDFGGTKRGVLKSIDGGAHWLSLSVTALYGLDINSIVPTTLDSGNVVFLAATSTDKTSRRPGVWRSKDGGATFTQLKANVGLPKGGALQVIADPSDPKLFYAAIKGSGIYRTTNGGDSWTAMNTGIDLALLNGKDDDRDGTNDNTEESIAHAVNIRLAVHFKPNANPALSTHAVYAAISGEKRKKLMGVFRLTDPAVGWKMLGAAPDATPSGQGDTQGNIAADPNSATVVFVSGDTQTASPFVANIWREDSSGTGAATNWASVVMGGANNTAPHADSRAMIFDGNNNLVEADDGGITRLTNPNAAARAWSAINGNLQNTEFYSVAYDTFNNRIFGGAQDVGSPRQTVAASAAAWVDDAHLGDGAVVGLDNSNAGFSYRYTSTPQLGSFERTKFDASGAVTETKSISLNITGAAAGTTLLTTPGTLQDSSGAYHFDNNIQPIQPFTINSVDQTRILIGTTYLYEATNPTVSGATLNFTTNPIGGLLNLNTNNFDDDNDGTKDEGDEFRPKVWVGLVTAMAYGGMEGATKKPEIAYVGGSGGSQLLIRTTAAGNFTPAPNWKAAFGNISDIVLDPTNWKRAYIATSKGVFQTTDGGANFTNITSGPLIDETGDFHSIELVQSGGKDYVLVGGRGGVYVTGNNGGVWRRLGRSIPNAPVMDIHYVGGATDKLIVGTFGRGVWMLNTANASIVSAGSPAQAVPGSPVAAPLPAPAPGVLEINGDETGITADSIRLVLDAANPSLLNVFLNNSTDTPNEQIEVSSLLKIVVNGLGGDDTLTIDDSNGTFSVPQGISFDDGAPGNDKQEEINQSPIGGDVVTSIRNGLQKLADWGDQIAKFGEAAKQIPGLGKSLADMLSIGDGSNPIKGFLQQGLVNKVFNYLNNDVTPTAQELTKVLKGLSSPMGNVSFVIAPDSVKGGVFTNPGGSQELRFDVTLDASSLVTLSTNFGADLSALGVSITGNGSVDVSTSFKFDFSFGYDLTPNLGPGDAFFIRVQDLGASVSVTAGQFAPEPSTQPAPSEGGEEEEPVTTHENIGTPFNLSINIGFLNAQILNGAMKVDAELSIGVNNPDEDPLGNITLNELTGTSLGSLLDIDVDGDLKVELPISVSLAGLSLPATPVIHVDSEHLFGDVPEVSAEGFDKLLNFDNLSPLALLGMLKQVGSFLTTFKGSAALSTKIPFTSKTVGDIIDIGNAFTDKLYKFLEPQPGKAAFDSVDSLVQLLASTLNLTPQQIGAQYDDAANTLTFHVKIADAFAPQSLPVDLGLSLGSLAGLSTSSTLSVSASAGIEFTFGIILSAPSAKVTGNVDAPANGRLSSAAHFSVVVGGNDAVDVTVAADATNNSLDDLVADINTALTAAGLGDTVKAGKNGNKITFATQGLLTPSSITVNCTSGDSAETQIGFNDSQSASDSIGSRFFIKDASVTGSATLSATDIDANAHLGFLSVGVVNGTGGITANFNAQLVDPGTDAADGKITFTELFNALANNVSSLVPTPTLAGSANLTLPLAVTPNIFGAGAPAAPAATVTWTDITNPSTLNVSFNADTSKLLDFQNISFAGVLQAILQGVQYVASLEKFSFLSTKLPLLNKSVSDLLGAADQLIQKVNAAVNASPADALQTLASTLATALGLPSNAVNLIMDTKAIKVGLAFHAGGTQQIPINFDLASLAAGVPGLSQVTNLVDVSGAGNLTVGANADFNLNLGVDVTNPTSPRPFLYDDSNIHFDAKAKGAGLNFTASVGPLGLFIKNASVNLDGDGNPNTDDSAQFNVTIINDNGDGRHYFDELDTGDVNMTLTGQVHATLPLFFPTQTSALNPPLSIAITDLSHISTTTTVTTPNLDIQFNAADLLSNVGAMIDGLDLLLKKLGDGTASQVLNRKLPLVGGNLKDAIKFIDNIRTNGIEPLKAQLGDKPAADALKNALFAALGPSNLGVLGDLDGNGTIDLNDVGVALGNGGSQILFTMRLHEAPNPLDLPVGFDVGLPGLALSVTGGVQAKVGFDMKLSFGLNKTDGFFFVTDTRDASNNPIPEMNLSVDATIPDFSAKGTLAILQVQATDSTTSPTHLGASFSVDLKDPNNDGKLTMAEMAAGPALSDIVKAKLTAQANVNLHLVAGFGGGASFPTISADFAMGWGFNNAPTDAPDASFGNKPTVTFTNIQLNAGEFFSNFAKPILDNVQKVLKPIQPIIDILTTKLPVLSDIKVARNLLDFDHSGDVTILDLVHLYNPNSKLDFITSLAKTAALINSIPTNLNNLMLNLGHFDVGSDLRSVTTLKDTDLTNIVQNAIDPQLTGSAATFNSKLADLNSVPGGGLAFPILKSPSSVFKLMIGQDINLFTYDTPTLSATFQISEFFPVLGPLGARFTGSLGAAAHFGFGYDTTGLREFIKADSTSRTLSMLLDGLYVSDRKNADGTGDDVPEATLTGGITAAAELNLGIASAGVSGGIFAKVNFNLHDPDKDGKMRLNELVSQFQKGPLAIFDVSGDLTAGLSAYISFLFSTKTFNLATVKLLDFNVDTQGATHPDPILATMLPGGVLQLNVGANAAARQFGDLGDGDDVVTVSTGTNAGSITVEAFGFSQDFTGVSKIVGDGGAGNDTITIKNGINVPVSLTGGAGNDSLFGGDGGATLDGGAGDDQLSGGNGADKLTGSDGNDLLLGNGGSDTITGGIGNDTAEGGDGTDVITGDVGDDVLSGGVGDDNIDAGDGNDALNGDEGSDTLTAGIGNDQLDGDDGNDLMLGGDGNDTFTAGTGNDTAFGGIGNDNIDGGSGNDQLFGEDGADTITAGTGNDTVTGDAGGDVIDAGAGNDSVTGGAESDEIDAGAGDDFVDAGDGDDEIVGDTGSDTVIGGLGADDINAGPEEDSVPGNSADVNIIYGDNQSGTGGLGDEISGDIGHDEIHGGDGADNISGLGGDDLIFGDAGDDSITGGAGNDVISGGDGIDVLSGQEGDDAISGDVGFDYVSGDAGSDLLWGGAAEFTRAAFVGGGFAADGVTPLILNGNTVNGLQTDGRDSVLGGIGNDWVFGGGDTDQVYGGADNDYVDGGSGNDTASGDAGNDVVRGGGNNDLVHGGDGIDQVFGDDGDDQLFGDAGDAAGNQAGQKLFGGAGLDVLFAYAATNLASEFNLTGDEMHGGDDKDTLNGNIRKDKLFGDGGDDLILGDSLAGPLYLSNTQPATFGAADQLFGGTGEDQLFGGGGSDLVFGGGDSDRLEGQDGADSLYGGTSIDIIVMDVDPTYTTSGDMFDGQFGNEAQNDVLDDGATDILLINGTNGNDNIKIGENAGQLSVNYNGRILPATWRGPGGPLIEQFRVSGLNGDDRIEYLSGAGGIDVSALTARSDDFVGVIDGGPGNDTLIGTNGRDRLDGGSGADSLQGMAGDDRLFGGGAAPVDSAFTDQLFGGQGNDDLVGGPGFNKLFAWTRDPVPGAFGVFVDGNGVLQDDDGDLNNDGKLDSDPTKPPFAPEDTGMNRMLGGPNADSLFGGTGLDFMFGNGGTDKLFNRDGTAFENIDDNGVAGQQWKDYARSTNKVWYVGGSNLDDIITVDFVTEPGVLGLHHLVTRLSNNNGNFTFAAQVQLDFQARNPDGSLVWDPSNIIIDPATGDPEDPNAFSRLLPPEGDFQAILIDALAGNDRITVGPTVTKSVWIDGGAGNDTITMKSGNPILPDPQEGPSRNDTRQTAYNLTTDARVGRIHPATTLAGMTIDSPTDVDFYKFQLFAAIQGNLTVSGLSATDGMVVQILNSAGTVLATSVNGVVPLTGLAINTDFFLRVNSNLTPTIYQLAFGGLGAPVTINLNGQTPILRRDILIGGINDDVLSGGSGEDWVLGGEGNDVLSGGLDRQASDLLFGEGGDDTFQIVPDALPTIPGSDRTIVPTLTDEFDGGAGNDRVLFLGGDLDRNTKPVPDTIAIKFNTQLHRYELTSLIWDINNQRYETDPSNNPKQLFAFYQAQNTERTVIDTRAGDDEIHADSKGFILGGVTYGIQPGQFQQNAKIAALQILGGDGNDRIFGGAMGDFIDGGAGVDFISGGDGDDTVSGGSDNDVLSGNINVAPDRFESTIHNSASGRNDADTFAANLGTIVPGQTIGNLTLSLGDTGDWYYFPTPDALLRLGTSQAAYLTSDMITVTRSDSGPTKFFLFAGRQVDPTDPTSILPLERPTGVPAFYMIHVVPSDPTVLEQAGMYSIGFSAQLGKTIHVPPTQADFTVNSANPGDQPAVIPLGDINGDGRVDFIGAIQDYSGSLADYHNASNFNDYPGNSADVLPPSFARIYFSGTPLGNVTLATNAVTLKLPAPVSAPSFFNTQTIFANPADYNGDGISDIAVAVTMTSRFFGNEAPFWNEGVYIIFGRATGFSGTIDVIRDADVTIKGFAPAGTATSDNRLSIAGADVNNDGFDDLLVGNRAFSTSPSIPGQGATYLFLGRSKANWNAVTNRVVFSADFNDAGNQPFNDGFVVDPLGVNSLWHTSNGQNTQPGHTPNGDLYFGVGETTTVAGNYDGLARTGRIVSPSMSLGGLATATLNFKYFLSTEALNGANFDRARVMVSLDNGASFTPLQVRNPDGTFRDAGAANRVAVNGGVTNQPGLLNDPTSGWINASFDLSRYVGNTNVKIAFEFTSNATNNNFEGWYVDDVTISGALLSPAQANATFTGTAVNEFVGSAVSGIGDFNHDGKKDFAILRAGVDATTPGQAYIIFGRGTSDAAFTSAPVSNVANIILRNDKPFTGYGIRPAGDVDGDTFADLLITPGGGSSLIGGLGQPPPPVSLVFGRTGLSGSNLLANLSGVLRTSSRDSGWVALGDVNGDGVADLGANSIHVTTPLSESTSTLTQIRHAVGEVFFGRTNRNTLSLETPDLVIEPGKPNYDSPSIRSNVFNSPGDIDKDLKSDFVLADSFGGFSRVYLGKAVQTTQSSGGGGGGTTQTPEDFQFPLADPSSGPPPANPPGLNLATSGPAPDASTAFEIHGSQTNEHLSNPRSAGDINGDGIDDLIVDGNLHSYIIFGPANINGRVDVASRGNIVLDHADGVFAQRMADVNGDGLTDLLFYQNVVSPGDSTLFNLTVGIFLSGGAAQLPHHLTMANATRTISFVNGFHFDGNSAPADRTFTISALKFNDDNFADILIAARGQGDDAADVISGARLLSDPDGALKIDEQYFINGNFQGSELPYLRIERDGTDRAAVQTQLYGPRTGNYAGSSQQQLSAVVAGDVNGDGLEDIVFADKGYAIDLGPGGLPVTPNIGRGYLFLGTFDNAIPERQPNRSLDRADRIYQGASFGENVSAVGDVNGDGYADFAVSRIREGNALAPASLLFYYGRPTIAGALIGADVAADQLVKKSGDAASSVFLEGALYATTGDFNGDGKLDLAVGEPRRTIFNAQNTVLDITQRGQVYVFFSIADRAKGISLTSPDRIINGEGEFDNFGVLSATGPIDLDRDHVSDLLIGAAGADVVSPSLIPGGGKIYVVYDGVVAPAAPPGSSVGSLTNTSVTGDGDFIVGAGGPNPPPVVFKDPDANNDGIPDTTNYVLPAGQSERWYTFTTLGDGQAASSIRITPPAAETSTTLQHGRDTGVTSSQVVTGPGDPVSRVDGFTSLPPGTPPSPAAETVDHMFDGFTQKYLNLTLNSSGAIVTPQFNGGNGTVVNGIRFFTANDAPERDPSTYSLEGTNDDLSVGTPTWSPIPFGAFLNLPAGRNPGGNIPIDPNTQFNQTLYFNNTTSYKSYRIKFIFPKNTPVAAQAIQIGEVQLLSDISTFHVGGLTNDIGLFEFDLSPWLKYADQPNLIQNAKLQLDYQNSVLPAGQKVSVFVSQAESDGVVGASDAAAALTFAGERLFNGADPASGLLQIDITAAIRAAVAAGKTRISMRLVASGAPSSSVDLTVHSTMSANRQTGLVVTTARQHGVIGDLIDPKGNVLARGLSVISLRPFDAGTYFLRVYDPFGAAPQQVPFAIEMTVPAAGETHPDADRDQVSGGDGDDIVTGGTGLDRTYGNSGNDTIIGDDVEAIDQQPGEFKQDTNPDNASNRKITDADPILTIADPGLRNAIADALGIGHTTSSTGFTRPFFASQLAQIRELDASNRLISDLTGLEQLINLETLNLSHNNLLGLDFVDAAGHHGLLGLTHLTSLDLSYNRISDTSLTTLAAETTLKSLNLDGNRLRSISPLSALTGLTFLSIDGTVTPFALLPGTTRGNDQIAKFANPSPVNNDKFGFASTQVGQDIAISDPGDNSSAGAVYIYDGSSGQLKLTLRGTNTGDQFGFALASSGNLLFVGAPFAHTFDFPTGAATSGTVYIYDVTTGRFMGNFAEPNAGNGDQFGSSMAVLGQSLFVGAPNDNPFFTGAVGTAYKFDIPTRSTLIQYFPIQAQSATGDRFGASISAFGNEVFIGVPGRDAGGLNFDSGAVVVYSASINSGSLIATITNPSPGPSFQFGSSLAIVGGNLAVGMPAFNGAVHLYNATTNTFVRSITPPGAPNSTSNFGSSLAAYDDTRLLVGSPANAITQGFVHLIDTNTGAALQTFNDTAFQFGASVSVINGDIMVGAPNAQISGLTVGSATLFKGPRITDISPIAALTNLKSLSLGNQRISDISSLGTLTKLQSLNLQANQITGNLGALVSMPALTTLSINRNPLDNTSFTTSIPALTSRLTTFTFDPDQAPLLPITPVATPQGVPVTITVTGTDPDAGDAIFLGTASSDDANVTVQFVGNQLTLTPAAAFTGVAHITVTAFDGPSGALDWRGRSVTRTFDLSVGLAAITGAKFNDFNNNGTRDPGDTGVSGWQIFLDSNNNGAFDNGEPLTATNADGNYVFSGLAPGNYVVGEIGLSAWFPTVPRTLLTANFTGGAQGFVNTGASDPWHLTTRRGADAGHTGTQSFYFGSEATGTYANNSTGTLTSPMIDLRGTTGPVRLDFNSFLDLSTGTTPISASDFSTTTAGTVGSLDGYTASGLWHFSNSRGTQAGHSSNFSMYFGSEVSHTYAANSTGNLLSPLINLVGLTGKVTLNLSYFLSANSALLGGSFDAASISVIDAASNQTILASNGGTKSKLVNTSTSGLTPFTPLSLSLTQFVGQQIRLLFTFTADGDSRIGEGWYVDDVTVSAASADVATVGVLSNGVFTPLVDSTSGLPSQTGVWNPVSLDLTPFDGQQIQLQYKFTSDATGVAEGWYIDDPKVTIGVRTSLTLLAGQVATGIDFGGVQVPNIGADQSVTPGQLVSITPVITDPDPNNGNHFSYGWGVSASNGQIIPGATTSNYSFTPNSAGIYTVSLSVTDLDDGNKVYTDTAIYTVTGDPAGLTTTPGATYSFTGTPAAPILNILTGAVTIAPTLYAAFPNLSATVANGAVLNLDGSQHLTGLTLANGALANVLGGGTLTTDALSLTGSATLDLGSGFFIFNYQAGQGAAALAQVAALIKAGYNNGAWNGPGIASSLIASTFGRGIGFQNNNNGAGGAILPTFGGQSASANSMLARFTLAADANLDGAVGFQDLIAVAQHYNQPANAWNLGDFNFDGTVGFADFVAVAQSYNQALPAQPIASAPEELAPALVSAPAKPAAAPVSAPAPDPVAESSATTPVAGTSPAPVLHNAISDLVWTPVAEPIPAAPAIVSKPKLTPASKPASRARATTFSSKSIVTKQSTSTRTGKMTTLQLQSTPTPASPFSTTRTKVRNELLA